MESKGDIFHMNLQNLGNIMSKPQSCSMQRKQDQVPPIVFHGYAVFITQWLVSKSKRRHITAWLAQLVECQSAVREVECSNPRPDQHSGC